MLRQVIAAGPRRGGGPRDRHRIVTSAPLDTFFPAWHTLLTFAQSPLIARDEVSTRGSGPETLSGRPPRMAFDRTRRGGPCGRPRRRLLGHTWRLVCSTLSRRRLKLASGTGASDGTHPLTPLCAFRNGCAPPGAPRAPAGAACK